jgi:hypothetical protein
MPDARRTNGDHGLLLGCIGPDPLRGPRGPDTDYTRNQAHQHRDRALAELEAAGVVDAEALESLRAIIVGVIKA